MSPSGTQASGGSAVKLCNGEIASRKQEGLTSTTSMLQGIPFARAARPAWILTVRHPWSRCSVLSPELHSHGLRGPLRPSIGRVSPRRFAQMHRRQANYASARGTPIAAVPGLPWSDWYGRGRQVVVPSTPRSRMRRGRVRHSRSWATRMHLLTCECADLDPLALDEGVQTPRQRPRSAARSQPCTE